MMNEKELCSKAVEAMGKAYAPYSKHKVGAALLTESGKIFTGCNIENAAYSPTVCAERVALFTAVAAGERNFKSIAVAGGMDGIIGGAFPPCGVCRQVMAEFCSPDFTILVVTGNDTYNKYSLSELLPEAFTPKNIE